MNLQAVLCPSLHCGRKEHPSLQPPLVAASSTSEICTCRYSHGFNPFVAGSRTGSASGRRGAGRSDRKNCHWRPHLEVLEDRNMPTTINWIGGAAGNFDVASNWSTHTVPGAADIAVINTTGAVKVTIQTGDAISVEGITTGANDTLSITGGSLTSRWEFDARRRPDDDGGQSHRHRRRDHDDGKRRNDRVRGSLSPQNRATLNLPGLTSYTANGNDFEASGTGSLLNVSALTKVTMPPGNGGWAIDANSGGEINLGGLTSLTGPNIDIYDTGGSTILDGHLKSLRGVGSPSTAPTPRSPTPGPRSSTAASPSTPFLHAPPA